MPNLYIPREQIHAWVEQIGENPANHKTVLTFLVRSQRRLAKYVDVNAKQLTVGSRGTSLFLLGLIARCFDKAGGRTKTVSMKHMQDAEARINGVVVDLLPLDDGFAGRVRQVEWRAQPHILDECLMSLFDDPDLDSGEMAKMFFLMWVVIESFDSVWSPPAGFEGQDTYTYVHIEPS
jgi:hypothetical protein